MQHRHDEYFFRTQYAPYGIALNEDRSARIIEVLAQYSDNTDKRDAA